MSRLSPQNPILYISPTASELTLERGRRGEQVDRVLEEGAASPSPPNRGFAGAL